MPTIRKTPFDIMLSKLAAQFPDLIRPQSSRNEPVSLEGIALFNTQVRLNGNILFTRPEDIRLSMKPGVDYLTEGKRILMDNFRAARDYLKTLGYKPKLQPSCINEKIIRTEPEEERLLYDIPVGICEIRLVSGKRKTLLCTQDMVDRINIGYEPFDWEGRPSYIQGMHKPRSR